jgi:hypothetical protein
MVIAIHQPNFAPWAGYFYKMLCADAFVYLDSVQFTKNGYQNRIRINTSQGPQWLTVPVLTKGHFGTLTKDVLINNALQWPKIHLKTLETNYRRAPYYEEVMGVIRQIYERPWTKLAELNLEILEAIRGYLEIKTPIHVSSLLLTSGNATELLISICRYFNADSYLSGKGGQNYQDEKLFSDQGIRLLYSEYQPRPYRQIHGEFVPGLSVLDGMFNLGKEFRRLIS